MEFYSGQIYSFSYGRRLCKQRRSLSQINTRTGEYAPRRKLSFLFEKKSLVFDRDKKHFTQHPSRRSDHHVNMTEHAVHFWRMRLGPEVLLITGDFYFWPLYSEEFSSYTNVVSKIPVLSLADTVFIMSKLPSETGNTGWIPMVRPKQKPVALMSYLISTYTRPDAMMLDPCLASGATARACLILLGVKRLKVATLIPTGC